MKNQFSHIFPASAWSPFLSVILTDKLACLVLCELDQLSELGVLDEFCESGELNELFEFGELNE